VFFNVKSLPELSTRWTEGETQIDHTKKKIIVGTSFRAASPRPGGVRGDKKEKGVKHKSKKGGRRKEERKGCKTWQKGSEIECPMPRIEAVRQKSRGGGRGRERGNYPRTARGGDLRRCLQRTEKYSLM